MGFIVAARFSELRTHAVVELQRTDLSILVQEVLAPEMVRFSNSGARVKSCLGGLPPIMLEREKQPNSFSSPRHRQLLSEPGKERHLAYPCR